MREGFAPGRPPRWRDIDGDLIVYLVEVESGHVLEATIDDTPELGPMSWRHGEHGNQLIKEPVIGWCLKPVEIRIPPP